MFEFHELDVHCSQFGSRKYNTFGNVPATLQSQGFAPTGSSFDFFAYAAGEIQGAQYFLTQYIMSKTNNRPRYTVYAVKDQEGKPSRYTAIGAAFEMKDSKGLTIQLDALPTNGRILCFAPKSSNTGETPAE